MSARIEQPDPWVAQARLGADAEAFLAGPIGRALEVRANRIIRENTVALVKAAPEALELGRELRREIQRAGDALDWLLEMITDGRQAREEIAEQDAID